MIYPITVILRRAVMAKTNHLAVYGGNPLNVIELHNTLIDQIEKLRLTGMVIYNRGGKYPGIEFSSGSRIRIVSPDQAYGVIEFDTIFFYAVEDVPIERIEEIKKRLNNISSAEETIFFCHRRK